MPKTGRNLLKINVLRKRSSGWLKMPIGGATRWHAICGLFMTELKPETESGKREAK
jgi:hypothetical protein